MKCFDRSGDEILYKKSKANVCANSATKKLIEIEVTRNELRGSFANEKYMSTAEISKLKKRLKVEEK